MSLSPEHRDALYKCYSLKYKLLEAIRDRLDSPSARDVVFAAMEAEELGVPRQLIAPAEQAAQKDFRAKKPMADIETFQSGRKR